MLPLRLAPGQDLRAALMEALHASGAQAGYVLQGMGSLGAAMLRYAGRAQPTALAGDMEILTLAGSLAPDGVHLHMSVSDADGVVRGGHVTAGCVVRTTAEVLVALLPAHRFDRVHDAATGYPELLVSPARADGGVRSV
ncbi:PPC domain-containing DNA-binding protein [Oxalobacteraceae bacterium A2-2]